MFFDRVLEFQEKHFSITRFQFNDDSGDLIDESIQPTPFQVSVVKSRAELNEQASRTSLVILFHEHQTESSWLHDSVFHYPGPILILNSMEPQTFAVELDAACQAMLPIA